MTDIGCLYLALGFTAGLAAAAAITALAWTKVAEIAARARSNDLLHASQHFQHAIEHAAKMFADAYRHRTEVSGGFLRPPEPEPPPPDPRVSKGIEFIERLGLSQDETNDLIGGYEMLAGVRAGDKAQIAAFLQRFRRLGVPLPS